MNLSHEFNKATNLGTIAKKWFVEIEKRMQSAGIESVIKTGVEGAASLLMPAAMIANIIKIEGLPSDRALRVLVLGDDPVPVMDRGVWLSFVSELAGVGPVDCYCTCEKVIESNLFSASKQLGLPPCPITTLTDARDQYWDLAVWVHPAIEAGECAGVLDLLPALHAAGVPLYACMFNELDALIQNHGLAQNNLEFGWLNASAPGARLTKTSINKFAYSTSEVGIEGGWGAVLTKVQAASKASTPEDWELIKVAMALFRLEGSASATWSFGEVVPGVSFNQCKPVGLIGNVAVDPVTGLLLAECSTSKILKVVGHVWTEMLGSLPKGTFELVPWAARIKLSFNNVITREQNKRTETIKVLEDAFASGLVDAGMALARGYERMDTELSNEKAMAIYSKIGTAHPMSAYALAHDALAKGEESKCVGLLRSSAEAGYVPAITDLACVLLDAGNLEEAHRLLTIAMDRGSADAAFRLAEMLIKNGMYEDALPCLRASWSKGHADALNTAHWLCTSMLDAGLGKSGPMKRELKEVQFAISKRTRYANAVETKVD